MTSLSETLLEARKNNSVAQLSEQDLPQNLQQAYACSLAQMNAVQAWKIGGANPWSRAVFDNKEVFFGPLHPHEVFFEDGSLSLDGLVAPLAEPEVMLEIGDVLSDRLEERFPRMGLGFEIPASVLPDSLKPQLTAQVSDRGGAGALWVSAIQPFDEDLFSQGFQVRLSKNTAEPVNGNSDNVINGPLGAAEEFLDLAPQYNMPVAAGQWIASGGLCPAVPITGGDVLTLEAWGRVLRLTLS